LTSAGTRAGTGPLRPNRISPHDRQLDDLGFHRLGQLRDLRASSFELPIALPTRTSGLAGQRGKRGVFDRAADIDHRRHDEASSDADDARGKTSTRHCASLGLADLPGRDLPENLPLIAWSSISCWTCTVPPPSWWVATRDAGSLTPISSAGWSPSEDSDVGEGITYKSLWVHTKRHC
jgi:hypothetical protein